MPTEDTSFNPGKNNDLLDTVKTSLGLKNDAALARALEVAPPVISKVRNARLPIGSALLIKIHEISGFPLRELKRGIGQRSLDPFKPM